jgi:hypothetical protein
MTGQSETVALDRGVRTIIQDAEGRRSCVTAQCLPTPWVIIQTDPLRFFLPFDYHLQTITEAPISARASAYGIAAKMVLLWTSANSLLLDFGEVFGLAPRAVHQIFQ